MYFRLRRGRVLGRKLVKLVDDLIALKEGSYNFGLLKRKMVKACQIVIVDGASMLTHY